LSKQRVVFFQEENGHSPIVEWLKKLKTKDRRGWARCFARIEQLRDYGHELRRPASDYLDDGIRELRVKHGRIQYRILYFFHRREIAVLSHGFVKKSKSVPVIELERAVKRKQMFEQNPDTHTFKGKVENG